MSATPFEEFYPSGFTRLFGDPERHPSVYLACPLYGRQTALQRARWLKGHGIGVASKWHQKWSLDHADPNVHPDELKDKATLCRAVCETAEQIRKADALIQMVDVVDERGFVTPTHYGHAVELGYGMGAGKVCVVIGKPNTMFHFGPQCIVFETWENFTNSVKRLRSIRGMLSAAK